MSRLKDGNLDRGAAAWRPPADSWAGCLHSGVAVAGAECSLFPPWPPLPQNRYLELVLQGEAICAANVHGGKA
eukprot:1150331-Pelagomonas_calceolata.AAC.2